MRLAGLPGKPLLRVEPLRGETGSDPTGSDRIGGPFGQVADGPQHRLAVQLTACGQELKVRQAGAYPAEIRGDRLGMGKRNIVAVQRELAALTNQPSWG